MKTSYFGKRGKPEELCISIARSQPKNKNYPIEIELMPTWDMIKKGYGYAEYVDLLKFRKVDPHKILKKYSNNILLCWEKDRSNCHRGFLARWIKETIGVSVEEFGEETEGNEDQESLFE